MPCTHHVGRLHLDIGTADLDTAMQLRARAEELARRLLPDTLARVLDALDPAGLHLRIERIELDLGEIAADALERDVPAALQRTLTEALTQALASARHAPGPQGRALSGAAARLEDFDDYLAHGTLPRRPARMADDAAEALQHLVAEQPRELAGVLRRHAHDRRSLERLVLQAGEAGLLALLALLAPAEASAILAYLGTLRHTHAEARVRPAPDAVPLRLAGPALDRALWLLTLEYLLRDAGTQFNRRSYLASLLQGLADTEGVAYADLLCLLHATHAAARERQPLDGTLLGVLDALLEETVGGRTAASASSETGDKQAAQAAPQRPETSPRDEVIRLVAQVAPQHAQDFLNDIAALARAQHEAPWLALSAEAFERLLWQAALQLLRSPSPSFGPAWWRPRLLHGLAQAVGMRPSRLASAAAAAGEPFLLSHAPPPDADTLQDAGDAASGQDPTLALCLASRDVPTLLAQLARAERLPREALLRELAGDMGLLLRVVAAMDGSLRQQLLASLDGLHAGEVMAVLQGLPAPSPASALAAPLDAETPAENPLAWALAFAALVQHSGEAFDRARLRRQLIAGLARHEGVSPATLEAPRVASPEDPLLQVERFLREGRPEPAGLRLGELARDDPAGLATLLRRLRAAAPGQTATLLARLLSWLLPEEVAAVLWPGHAEAAAGHAEVLAHQSGSDLAAAWQQVLEAALDGAAPPQAGISAQAAPAAHLDRQAWLRHWMDHGRLPSAAPVGLRPEALLADLPRLSVLALHALFCDQDDPRRTAARLRRVGMHAGLAWLAPLLPWAFAAPGRPATAHLRGLEAQALDALRIQAAAALLAGRPIDAGPWSPPLPAMPEARAEALSSPSGTGLTSPALLDWLTGSTAWHDTAPPAMAAAWPAACRLLADQLDRGDRALEDRLRQAVARPEVRERWLAHLPEEVLARLLHRLAPARARFMLDTMTVMLTAWRPLAPRAARGEGRRAVWSVLLASLAGQPAPAPRTLARCLADALQDAGAVAPVRWLAEARSLARRSGCVHLDAVLHPAALRGPGPAPPPPAGAPPRLPPSPPAPARRHAACRCRPRVTRCSTCTTRAWCFSTPSCRTSSSSWACCRRAPGATRASAAATSMPSRGPCTCCSTWSTSAATTSSRHSCSTSCCAAWSRRCPWGAASNRTRLRGACARTCSRPSSATGRSSATPRRRACARPSCSAKAG